MIKKGLGRGLDSLIPKKVNASNYSDFNLNEDSSIAISSENQIIMINPKEIVANPYQPRKSFDSNALEDLKNSIKENGIIQPLVVSKKDGKYELIAGERRLRSAVELNIEKVPVIVRDVSDQKKLELALIENIQRENLNPIESAIAYNQLINEFNLNQDELAKKVGKARSSIANILRLLNLPQEIQDALSSGQISEAHAKYLLGLDSEVKQLTIFKKILYNNLSVRETNNLIRQNGGTKKYKNIENKNNNYDVYQEKLRNHLSTKVEIKKNSINISFQSEEDLKEILNKIL